LIHVRIPPFYIIGVCQHENAGKKMKNGKKKMKKDEISAGVQPGRIVCRRISRRNELSLCGEAA
jgi:hypothetical protein